MHKTLHAKTQFNKVWGKFNNRGSSCGWFRSSVWFLLLFSDKYSSQFGGGSQYAYFHEEDETSFQLVDTAKTQKTAYQRNRMRFAQVTQNLSRTTGTSRIKGSVTVSTEEPAQRQGPQESDPVQHADAPEERQAEGEGSDASAEEVPEAVWSPTEVGPEVSGPAEAQRLVCGGSERLGGEGGDGLPPTDEDEIHGGVRPGRHVGGADPLPVAQSDQTGVKLIRLRLCIKFFLFFYHFKNINVSRGHERSTSP
uniref:Uncharacterized protein n=1 Tax=Poecilia reticulata TaxID=8081 RepID=A0A3P9PAF7_POERE